MGKQYPAGELWHRYRKAWKAVNPKANADHTKQMIHRWQNLRNNKDAALNEILLLEGRAKAPSSLLLMFKKMTDKELEAGKGRSEQNRAEQPDVELIGTVERSNSQTSNEDSSLPGQSHISGDSPECLRHSVLEPEENQPVGNALGVNNQDEDEPQPRVHHKPAQDLLRKKRKQLQKELDKIIKARELGLETSGSKKEKKRIEEELNVVRKALRKRKHWQKAAKKRREKIRNEKLSQATEPYEPPRQGRPSKEVEYPDLQKTILSIVEQSAAADGRRRTNTLFACRTLDDLVKAVNSRGIEISRTALYYRLEPTNARHLDGKRHMNTVNVKLRRAHNDLRKAHPDTHFACATLKYCRDMINRMGRNCVNVISMDDKCRVPLGLAAANLQSPILMRMDCRVKLPDHDYAVAPGHKLIPSVYAQLTFKEDELSFSGPTTVCIRSAKHDSSSAKTHRRDLHQILEAEDTAYHTQYAGCVKPILVLMVDGGPDQAPRFPKTLKEAIYTFQKLNLDAVYILTNAPGQSALNPCERRMSSLSRLMAGIILEHDHFGNHLNSSGKTIDPVLEKKNLFKAGSVLAEVFQGSTIDGFEVKARFVPPMGHNDNQEFDSDAAVNTEGQENGDEVQAQSGSDTHFQIDEPEELVQFESPYQEALWKYIHVRQSQYVAQIVKCDNDDCCGVIRSNLKDLLPNGFIPPPIRITASSSGPIAADPKSEEGRFYDLFQRLALKNLDPVTHEMPFDEYCPSVQDKIKERVCNDCGRYFATQSSLKHHKILHRNSEVRNEVRAVSPNPPASEPEMIEINVNSFEDLDGVNTFIIEDMNAWMQSDFEETTENQVFMG